MAAGSIFLAPLADKIGRRLLILVCLVIAGLSMLGCAFVQSHGMLAALRFITGIGVGASLRVVMYWQVNMPMLAGAVLQ